VAGGASARLVHGAIAQEREENPGEPAGLRDHRDALAAPRGNEAGPYPQRRHPGTRSRSIETAAWMSNQRTRLDPGLVIRPRRWISPLMRGPSSSPSPGICFLPLPVMISEKFLKA
jgi:hypothetical protein